MEPHWDQHPYTPEEPPKKSMVVRYVVSFIWMLLFTAAAFVLVAGQWFASHITFYAILVLAVAQVLLQLVTFMHLDIKHYRMALIFLCVGIFIAAVSAVGLVLM
jgi:cytochrome c oxidase subunit IV